MLKEELLLRDGEQLSLDLHDKRATIPWEGRSPRGLTKAANALFLNREGQKKRERSREEPICPECGQSVKGGAPYRGAPLLIPIGEG